MNRSVVVGALMGAVAAVAVAALAERSFPQPPTDAGLPPLESAASAGSVGGCGGSSVQGERGLDANDPWLSEAWFGVQED